MLVSDLLIFFQRRHIFFSYAHCHFYKEQAGAAFTVSDG